MSSPNDRNSPPSPSPHATDRRRSSFSANALAEMFARQPNSTSNVNSGRSGSPVYPGPITSAAAQAQRRRLSLTTLGLSGNPNQNSPFSSTRPRGESFSSNSTAANVDESPFEDDDRSAGPPSATNQFARRLSFGARALRDRQNNGSAGNANGRPSADKSAFQPPTAKSRGDGFNFADNMRTRAERGSISGIGMSQSPPNTRMHDRSKSVTTMEPPKEMPKAVQKAPDAFQERILKGDFYMD